MITNVAIGVFCIVFGSIHVVWPMRMHRFYQNHWLFRYFSGNSVQAMRVHSILLMGLGAVVIGVALTR